MFGSVTVVLNLFCVCVCVFGSCFRTLAVILFQIFLGEYVHHDKDSFSAVAGLVKLRKVCGKDLQGT